MKYCRLITGLFGFCLLTTGCHKKPESPAPQPTQVTTTPPAPNPPQPPPPVTNCTGATVMYSLPGGMLIPDNSTKDFVIPGFDYSCNDTLTVFIRNPQSGVNTGWSQLFDIPNGASFYSVLNQTVTVHNSTGIYVEVAIEAVLR